MALPMPIMGMLILYLLLLIPTVFSAHPFDPLSPYEINKVTAIIKASKLGRSSSNLTFHYVALEEPSKEAIRLWRTKPFRSIRLPRQAFAVVRANGKTNYELVVSLAGGRILSQRLYRGNGFPILTLGEQDAAIQLSLKYPPFVSSIKKRGLNVSRVIGSAFTIGWYGQAETKRAVKILFFYREGTANVWVRPVEGVEATVDLDKMAIAEYSDRQVLPVPKVDGTDYRGSTMKPPFAAVTKPITVYQPHGPSFKITGNTISWANWDFHLGFDPRAGIVISLATIFDIDQRKRREILYKGQISEVFVPYQDPTEDWYYRTFLDAGEFGMGSSAVSLQPFTDCPANAVFFDGYYASQDGLPVKISNAICLFEKYAGDIAWRHTETAIPGELIREVRPDVSLVVRMVTVVGNYDYILDWEFKKSGSIKSWVSLTGILEPKATRYSHRDEIKEKEDIFGTLVAANTIAINHDHFLTYYLDLDIDGEHNSFVKAKLQKRRTDGTTPRKSYWTVVKDTAKIELDARLRLTEPAEFLIVNQNKKTQVGNEVGYRLLPGPAAVPLLSEDDFPQIRGALSDFNIWVTPYNASQSWAAGLYVDRGKGDDTIKIWTNRNRDIYNKDIVLWHTIGFHHNPSQDEFPIMPALTGGFELRPANFFDRNPILRTRAPPHVTVPTCNATAP